MTETWWCAVSENVSVQNHLIECAIALCLTVSESLGRWNHSDSSHQGGGVNWQPKTAGMHHSISRDLGFSLVFVTSFGTCLVTCVVGTYCCHYSVTHWSLFFLPLLPVFIPLLIKLKSPWLFPPVCVPELSPEDMLWTTQPFAAKLGMVVHHHETECYAKEWVAIFKIKVNYLL